MSTIMKYKIKLSNWEEHDAHCPPGSPHPPNSAHGASFILTTKKFTFRDKGKFATKSHF